MPDGAGPASHPLGSPEPLLEDAVVLPRIVDGGLGPRLVATAEAGWKVAEGLRAVLSWPLDRAGLPTGDPDTLFIQRNHSGDASVSPDGRWLVFSHIDGGTPQVKVKPWPGPSEAEWAVSEGPGAMPLWRADGSYLTWVDPAAQRLYRIPVEGGISFCTGQPSSGPAPRGLAWVPAVQQLTSGFTAEARPLLLRPERDQRGLVLVTGPHRLLEERVREWNERLSQDALEVLQDIEGVATIRRAGEIVAIYPSLNASTGRTRSPRRTGATQAANPTASVTRAVMARSPQGFDRARSGSSA